MLIVLIQKTTVLHFQPAAEKKHYGNFTQVHISTAYTTISLASKEVGLKNQNMSSVQ